MRGLVSSESNIGRLFLLEHTHTLLPKYHSTLLVVPPLIELLQFSEYFSFLTMNPC